MFGTVGLILAVAYGITLAIRYLTKADQADIRQKIEAQGAKVIWVKRLDGMDEKSAPFDRTVAVSIYDVLVERDGVRRIEVWRDGREGIFKDH